MNELDWLNETPKKADENGLLIQGSDTWKRWRNKGLGSSDAAVLLGVSPWKTIDQLFGEKMGTWKPTFGEFQRRAMQRGTELEPVIRKWYEAREGALFPDGTAEHPVHPFMRASFDGINFDVKNMAEPLSPGRVLEIKAPNQKDHAGAKEGFIPEKYLPQCNWLMLIAGVKFCDYVSYGSDDTYAVVSLRADEAMQAELRRRAVEFWSFVEQKSELHPDAFPKWERTWKLSIDLSTVENTEPRPDLAGLTLDTEVEANISEQEMEILVQRALVAQNELKAAEAKFEALKDQLKKAVGDAKEKVCGEAVMGWIDKAGAVDYKSIPELIGIDLNQFRKKPTRAFYFERKKA